MATRFEHYITGDDGAWEFGIINWMAQTFTPSTAHKITSVKLPLYRWGSPGTITVSIKATDGNGHPTGDDLCLGTTDGNALTTDTGGEWREITLGAGANLAADTKYAIVARAPDSLFDKVYWRVDGTSPTYTGGALEWSNNSGSSWTTEAEQDFLFEEWGEPLGWTGKISGVVNPAKIMGVDVANIAKVKGVA